MKLQMKKSVLQHTKFILFFKEKTTTTTTLFQKHY